MQVAQQDSHITHAVLGGQSNISFGISDDPAFFQILSSALYKAPMLAMIRETICNGWDAHIDSDRTDRPLTITLTEEKLIIRDYGKGIPHELIGPIYGVYGASTKKNDGRQTGGFGLGCKSPFAYTDHFEVISHHDGKKTIYNMSKSSAERMGKPSIVTIASFPTTETGIQITIELKGNQEDYRMQGLIQQVVFNGDILATLNDTMLHRMGLDKAPNGFMLINNEANTNKPMSGFVGNLFVRYGNVIYPIEFAPQLSSLWNKVDNMVSKLYRCKLVLVAPPDSISITPSRESLTMSDLTVETLKTLFSAFLAQMLNNQKVSHRHHQMIEEFIDAAATKENHVVIKLSHDNWHVPGVPNAHEEKFLTSLDDFALLSLITSNRAEPTPRVSKWLKHINRYLEHLRKAGLIHAGMLQTWQNVARKNRSWLRSPSQYSGGEYYRSTSVKEEAKAATRWWYDQVAIPLVQKLQAACPTLKMSKISYFDKDLVTTEHKRGVSQPCNVDSVKLNNHTRNLRHLWGKPTVVLCHNKEGITKRLQQVTPSLEHGSYVFKSYFVVELPRTKDMAEKMIADITALPGVCVMDLTVRLPREEEAYQERKELYRNKRAATVTVLDSGEIEKPKKTVSGLVCMSSLLQGETFDTALYLSEVAERTTNPKFIEKISTAEGKGRETMHFSGEVLKAIVKLWGKQGAVTNNSGVYERQRNKGIMSINTFLADRVTHEIANNQAIKDHMAFDLAKVSNYAFSSCDDYSHRRNVVNLYKLLLTTPQLQCFIPDYTPLSEENQLRLVVWKHMLASYAFNQEKEVIAAKEGLVGGDLPEDTQEFIDKLIANKFVGLLDVNALEALILSKRKDPEAMAKILSVIFSVLN